MTDANALTPVRDGGERPVSHAVYGLYLVSPFLLGLPALVGFAMACARRDTADPVAREHFDRQIGAFWTSVAWLAAAAIWGGSAAIAGAAAIGTEAVDFGKPAAMGVLAMLAAAAAPLSLLASSVLGWARLASDPSLRHSRAP